MGMKRCGPSQRGSSQYDDGLDDDGNAARGAGPSRSNARGAGDFTGRPTGTQVAYQSNALPKFLQPYAHLLDKGTKPRRVQLDERDDDDDDDDEDDAIAVANALNEDAHLAESVGQQVVQQALAASEKEKGNELYKARDYAAAVEHYTASIQADNTKAAVYSNRSAAYAQLEEWEKAKSDAVACITLDKAWAKGWSRLGAAHMGLEEWSEAKEAYAQAMELEPDDKALQQQWSKADFEERQASREGKFNFNKRKLKGESTAQPGRQKVFKSESRPKARVLSFDDNDDEDE